MCTVYIVAANIHFSHETLQIRMFLLKKHIFNPVKNNKKCIFASFIKLNNKWKH